ncbi:ROK family protein [Nonomuraea sp. NPDC050556]|uniref:ROK family transcriptional regulator n=1 Tax=Nonomuraea sp. NPDC050556 TaxID=3364369 RepID=UPI0037A64D64
MAVGGGLQQLRRINSLSVLRALREGGPLAITELARRTGLSRPSTIDVVEELIAQGWVRELEPVQGGMGRPARRYRFRADAGYVLGLDIGLHKVLAVATDLDGRVIASGREQVGSPGSAAHLDAVSRAVTTCLDTAGLPSGAVWAATAGTTGVVSRTGKIVVSAAIDGWADVDLAGHLGGMLGCPVLVQNDSKLAALAESRQGVARGSSDLVFLHVGRRVGAGLIVDGKLLHGYSGATGEVGLLGFIGWSTASSILGDAPVEVFASARAGDASSLALVGEYAGVLARGAAALVLTLDPELIVLGGGFSRAGDVLLEPLRAALRPMVLRMPELRVSSLGVECVALGAACLARDRLDAELFT